MRIIKTVHTYPDPMHEGSEDSISHIHTHGDNAVEYLMEIIATSREAGRLWVTDDVTLRFEGTPEQVEAEVSSLFRRTERDDAMTATRQEIDRLNRVMASRDEDNERFRESMRRRNRELLIENNNLRDALSVAEHAAARGIRKQLEIEYENDPEAEIPSIDMLASGVRAMTRARITEGL